MPFFLQNSFLAILMLTILTENQSKEDELMKKCGVFFAGFFLLPKTVKFAKFSKKQVCNVKKKQLQCLLLLRP